MSKKTSKEDIMKLAAERNQELINSDKFDEIYQNVDPKMDFCCVCKTSCAGNTFSTPIRSYKNAKKTGCPECQKAVTSETHTGKEVSAETRAKIGKKACTVQTHDLVR
jgi:hypothetical protein